MRQTFFAVGVLVVSGCTTLHPDPPAAAGFVPVPGLYSTGDGTTEYSRTRLNADGTYVDLDENGPTGRGNWSSIQNTMCFDPEGDAETQQERCWTNGPADENGMFLSTRMDNGQSYAIKRISD